MHGGDIVKLTKVVTCRGHRTGWTKTIGLPSSAPLPQGGGGDQGALHDSGSKIANGSKGDEAT